MNKLPIGEQDFNILRKEGYIYVDKTAYIHQLMTGSGRFFFLARPRRFGKSLLLSTLKAVFEGKRQLFEGLYICDKTDWEKRYPVLHFDMSGLETGSQQQFMDALSFRLQTMAESSGIQLNAPLPAGRLYEFIDKLGKKTGERVVVLVDEYDKPIQDTLHKPELAAEIREVLRVFYTVIKASSESVHFVFLTGVSKISQVSIFSGLNNLNDISLDRAYAGICGYTQEELESNFRGYIDELAKQEGEDRGQLLEKIKYWYNGYSWDGRTFVYNPFSTLLLFNKLAFDSHWFRTGTPTFLLELMLQRRDFSPVMNKDILVNREFSDSQTLEKMDVVPLFFQTGYLTIKESVKDSYRLDIPNNEVRFSLSNFLLSRITEKPEYEVKQLADNFRQALDKEDLDTHLPHEQYYHALFQMVLLLTGVPSCRDAFR